MRDLAAFVREDIGIIAVIDQGTELEDGFGPGQPQRRRRSRDRRRYKQGAENDRLTLAWRLTSRGVRCRSRSAVNRPASGATNLARAAI